MRIHGLVVCVNYSDLLARSLSIWSRTLASLCVVTTPNDAETIRLVCATVGSQLFDELNPLVRPTVRLFQTDAFTRDGAAFNKGRAMQEARDALLSPLATHPLPLDWTLFFDADVIPPSNWLDVVRAADPEPGWLLGCRRCEEDGTPIKDGEIAGYFQLFHSADPRAAEPLDIWWAHAGNYDSRFAHRWPGNLKGFIPGLTLIHQGERGSNWCGRGNQAAMSELHAERIRRGGWQHESISIADPTGASPG